MFIVHASKLSGLEQLYSSKNFCIESTFNLSRILKEKKLQKTFLEPCANPKHKFWSKFTYSLYKLGCPREMVGIAKRSSLQKVSKFRTKSFISLALVVNSVNNVFRKYTHSLCKLESFREIVSVT
jgi:hypothetical protein